jgi:hypothetical protein
MSAGSRAVVFAGPSLPPSTAPSDALLDWRPPIRQGDLYKAALSRPALIGIIDGYFEVVPTVWHKEILWTMAQGIHVYGAGSIGALRAAELAAFGMTGVGNVYRKFRDGVLTDDDEVAVLHGPPELDYVALTEAMVNVRATVDEGLRLNLLEPATGATLVRIGKEMFYKARTYNAILAAVVEGGLAPDALARFVAWLPQGRMDQKRLDAFAMVQAMRDHLEGGVTPLETAYAFAHTFAWEEARQGAEAELEAEAIDKPGPVQTPSPGPAA